MKMSQLFGRTLREPPANAELTSHQLVLRAGLVRFLGGPVSTAICHWAGGWRARSRPSCARRWTRWARRRC